MARPIDYGEPKPMTAERILLRGGVLLAAAVGIGALGGWNKAVRAASDHAALPDVEIVARRLGSLSEQLEAAKGEATVIKLQLERANAILENSTRYQIPADLSAAIYDIALSEGIDPSLGYQLVKIESQFNRQGQEQHAGIRLHPASGGDRPVLPAEYQGEGSLRSGHQSAAGLPVPQRAAGPVPLRRPSGTCWPTTGDRSG